MNKKKISVLFVLTILCVSLFLFGCKQDTIKFYRESAASSLINKFKDENNTQSKSSGIIILRDDSSNSKNTINFGPRDINFDMPMRFK